MTPNLPHASSASPRDDPSNGEPCSSFINDILDLSKIEAGKLTWRRRDCPLRQILDDVLAVLASGRRRRG